MRQYLVRVHCCGSRWLVYVPAVELWAFAIAKTDIKNVAGQMIRSATGSDGELNLEEGRVLAHAMEFTNEHTEAKRWLPEEVSAR